MTLYVQGDARRSNAHPVNVLAIEVELYWLSFGSRNDHANLCP